MPPDEATAEQIVEQKSADFIFGSVQDAPPDATGQPPVTEGEEAEPQETEEVELTEEEEQAAEQLEEQAPEMFEVTVGETTYEVDQALKDELEKAKDYTQKTQGVKKEFQTAQLRTEELKAHYRDVEFQNSVAEERAQIVQADMYINLYRQHMRESIDNLSAQDIEKMRFEIEQMEVHKKALQDSIEVKQNEHQQAQEQAFAELLNKSTEVLKGKIPNWGDDTKKGLVEFAVAHGFAEAEVQNVADARQWEILWKAAEYDRIKEGTAKAVQKVGAAPKQIKPTARNPMPKDVQKKLNLRKKLKSEKLSDSDKANQIGEHYAERFNL